MREEIIKEWQGEHAEGCKGGTIAEEGKTERRVEGTSQMVVETREYRCTGCGTGVRIEAQWRWTWFVGVKGAGRNGEEDGAQPKT